MTRMTGPDCVVMCNLINTHTHTHTHAAVLSILTFCQWTHSNCLATDSSHCNVAIPPVVTIILIKPTLDCKEYFNTPVFAEPV